MLLPPICLCKLADPKLFFSYYACYKPAQRRQEGQRPPQQQMPFNGVPQMPQPVPVYQTTAPVMGMQVAAPMPVNGMAAGGAMPGQQGQLPVATPVGGQQVVPVVTVARA